MAYDGPHHSRAVEVDPVAQEPSHVADVAEDVTRRLHYTPLGTEAHGELLRNRFDVHFRAASCFPNLPRRV